MPQSKTSATSQMSSDLIETPSTAGALSARVNSNIDLVQAHISEQIGRIREECNRVERAALRKCEEAKASVEHVAEIAGIVSNLVSTSMETLQCLDPERPTKPAVKVISGGQKPETNEESHS